MAILCSQCGQTLPRDDMRFCNNCGALIPSPPLNSPEWGATRGASTPSASQPEDRRSAGNRMQNEPPAWISNLSKNERSDGPDRRNNARQPGNIAEVNTISDAAPIRQQDVGNATPAFTNSGEQSSAPAKNVRADNIYASASTWPEPATHIPMNDSASSVQDNSDAVQQDFPSVLPSTPRPKTPPMLHVKVWNEDAEVASGNGAEAAEQVPSTADNKESTQPDIEDMPTGVLSFGSDTKFASHEPLRPVSAPQPDRTQIPPSDYVDRDVRTDEHDADIEHLDTVSLMVQKPADTPQPVTERPGFNVVRENTPAPGGDATQIIEDKSRRSPSQPGWSSLPPVPSAGPTSSPGQVVSNWSALPPVPPARPTSSPGQVASSWPPPAPAPSSAGPISSPGQVASNWSSSAGPTSSPGQVAPNWAPSAGPTSSPGQVAPNWAPSAGPTSSPGQVASSWPSSPPVPSSGPAQGEREYAASTQAGNVPSFAPNTPSFPGAAPVTAATPGRRKSRVPLLITLVVIVLLLVGAVGSWVLFSHPFSVDPATEPTQSFQNANLGVSLLYPTKWSAHVDSGKAHVHFSDSSSTDQFDITTASASNTDLGQYLQDQVKQLGITAAKSGTAVTFAGASWQQIKGNLQVNGANYTEAIYVTTHNGHLYTITDIAPQSTFVDEDALVFLPTNTSLQFN